MTPPLAARVLARPATWAAQLYLRWRMNHARREAGLNPLWTSSELMTVAERRSRELVKDNSHHGAGVGIPDLFWGEIIGWVDAVGPAAADNVVDRWLQSPEHRPILLGRWTYIGAGVTVVHGRSYFVGLFGHRW